MSLFSPKKRKYFAACEYWIYLPGEKLPEMEQITTRMISHNPHSKDGYSAIGKNEGLLFSDIRLHISLVLRSKNPHVFRPDLFHDPVNLTPEVLTALSNSQSMAKIRYISEEALKDDRHLQFLPHMAGALCDLSDGRAVFDVVAEALYTCSEFSALLHQQVNVRRFDAHVRAVWHKHLHSGTAETKGLIKKGFPELKTDEAHLDQQVLVCDVLREAAEQMWSMEEMPREIDVTAYGDGFRLMIIRTKSGPYRVRIARMGSG